MATKEDDLLTMKPIGEDFWSHLVYEDQYGHLWKDITLGSDKPELYSVLCNTFDGDPNLPIWKPFIILSSEKQVDENKRFQYQMLDRLSSDCDYYLGYGNRSPRILFTSDEKKHIDAMKNIWNSFAEDEKPECLTWDQILEYEKAMCTKE